MGLASLPGKIAEYLALPGLNALELDVKDENGRVGFVPSSVPLARRTGAAATYYNAKRVARQVHARGVYLIGRIVTFEDPVLSEKRPDLAIRTSNGSIWRNNAGLGWTNPYDRRVWRYNVDLAVAAVRAGFDEIQFDYVRFPSDGDLSLIRYPGKHAQPMRWTIPPSCSTRESGSIRSAARVSVDVFGLSATRDLGIGQIPGGSPGTRTRSIRWFIRPTTARASTASTTRLPPRRDRLLRARGLRARQRSGLRGVNGSLAPGLLPGRTYGLEDVPGSDRRGATRAQPEGYLLWNQAGMYTPGAV